MIQYYVVIAADGESLSGGVVPAHSVALRRLNAGHWLLYRHTRNRKRVKAEDRLLVYTAGKRPMGGLVIAAATVSGINPCTNERDVADDGLLTDVPNAELCLSEIDVFAHPIELRSLRGTLGFLPQHERWGSALQGGCRSITKDDYEILLARAAR